MVLSHLGIIYIFRKWLFEALVKEHNLSAQYLFSCFDCVVFTVENVAFHASGGVYTFHRQVFQFSFNPVAY